MNILATGHPVGGAQEHTGFIEAGLGNLEFEHGGKLT